MQTLAASEWPTFQCLSERARYRAAKPDPRCFERLVADLHLTPHEVIYVGDDPLLDVEAGRAAGLLTAWMNRTGQIWPATVQPAEFNVGDCLELATQLGNVSGLTRTVS